ncbi:30S ribosomal protein S8 [Candidatus Margulisiibacteriota bacterium]
MIIYDPIADLLTRIRNGGTSHLDKVVIPYSKVKENILALFKKEGFISDFLIVSAKNSLRTIEVTLKYNKQNNHVIRFLKRVSKPGRRNYIQKRNIPRLKSGFGYYILSTSKGILTGRDARLANVGGEVLCEVG